MADTWSATGQLAVPGTNELEGFKLLTSASPYWQLRLPDDSTFEVVVTIASDGRSFRLTKSGTPDQVVGHDPPG